MAEPLHDLIVQAIIDDIMGFHSVSQDALEIRMSREFYARFAEWMYSTQKLYPTGLSPGPSFMNLPIRIDDWAYDWRIVISEGGNDMPEVPKEVWDAMKEFLISREDDIALDMENFGELTGAFFFIVGRRPEG